MNREQNGANDLHTRTYATGNENTFNVYDVKGLLTVLMPTEVAAKFTLLTVHVTDPNTDRMHM